MSGLARSCPVMGWGGLGAGLGGGAGLMGGCGGRGGQAKHQMDGNASGATRSDEERKRNESQVPKLHSTLGQHQSVSATQTLVRVRRRLYCGQLRLVLVRRRSKVQQRHALQVHQLGWNGWNPSNRSLQWAAGALAVPRLPSSPRTLEARDGVEFRGAQEAPGTRPGHIAPNLHSNAKVQGELQHAVGTEVPSSHSTHAPSTNGPLEPAA